MISWDPVVYHGLVILCDTWVRLKFRLASYPVSVEPLPKPMLIYFSHRSLETNFIELAIAESAFENVHYCDVIMGAMASQITSLTIVYSTVYSDADQTKHQSYASLAFVWGIHRWPVNSPHKWPVMWKMFPFDDVIMLQNGDDFVQASVSWVLYVYFVYLQKITHFVTRHMFLTPTIYHCLFFTIFISQLQKVVIIVSGLAWSLPGWSPAN